MLIADDDADNRRLLGILLERLGHSSVLAKDGIEALEAWTEARESARPFDCALVDFEMPRLDGTAFAARVRLAEEARPGSRRCRILAVTGAAFEIEDEDGVFDASLPKPFSVSELKEALTASDAHPPSEAES